MSDNNDAKINLALKMRRKINDALNNPASVYAGIPGPASVHNNAKASAQVPRSQVVKDLADLLRQMPLKEDEKEELFNAIINRQTWVCCSICGRLALKIQGRLDIHPSGDLSKPKVFTCIRHI